MNRLYGRSSAELREMVMDWLVRPACRVVFARDPRWEAVVLTVAQFYNDEASDAVHLRGVPIEHPWTDWDSLALLLDAEEETPAHAPRMRPWQEAWDSLGPGYHDNAGFITAFAAFCAEGAHQEMGWLDAWLPYAVIERSGVVRIVGELRQPWREDRFLVGYRAGLADDAPDTVVDGPLQGAPWSRVGDSEGPARARQELRPLLWRALGIARAAQEAGPTAAGGLDDEVLALLWRWP